MAGSISMGLRYVNRGNAVAGLVMVVQFPDGAVADAPTFLDSVTGSLGSDVTKLKILGRQVRLGTSQGQFVAVAKLDKGAMVVLAPTKKVATAIMTALIKANAAGAGGTADASPPAPQAVDVVKIGALMEKLAADPKDTVTLLALADEYYAGQQFVQAGGFLDKLLAIEPENVQALLARGAVSFNLGELDAAETTWTKVIELDPRNAEAHYDLGFLYLNSATPDWAGVQREWTKVIELDPTSELARTLKGHLDSMAAASMLP
jgi:tetratricopeptide (TPR) repeat protein